RVPELILVAISTGSVLMGANTYIGNGPNFMVKAIAEEAGFRMPSFFGFAARAVLTLAPIYVALVVYFALAW
ncbi:MAG: sodium:proton antiporter, partial [Sandaracinaceae bacterium]|nr:sodium:proton antiporter [Sandaracinaceae bacterium]